MKNDSIILTSIGLSTPNLSRYIEERFLNTQKKKVVIISTASEGKEENKYVKLAKVQFENLGFTEVIFVDLEKHESIPEDTTVIYVSGGNTYKLMKFAQESDFLSSVLKVVNQNDGIYVGVSAGSVILGNTIKGVELYDDIKQAKSI